MAHPVFDSLCFDLAVHESMILDLLECALEHNGCCGSCSFLALVSIVSFLIIRHDEENFLILYLIYVVTQTNSV